MKLRSGVLAVPGRPALKALLLAEAGADSIREGEDGQAAIAVVDTLDKQQPAVE